MNTQFFGFNCQRIVLTLLTISTVSAIAAPAKADDALIQESVQESVVTGADNLSIQNSNQSNSQSTEYRDRYDRYGYENGSASGNTGIVQRSDQYCDQVGEYNTCVQDTQQVNNSHNRRERRRH